MSSLLRCWCGALKGYWRSNQKTIDANTHTPGQRNMPVNSHACIPGKIMMTKNSEADKQHPPNPRKTMKVTPVAIPANCKQEGGRG
jgi:hypothetical protein